MKYKALLFDLDDTLWATFDNNKASLHRLYDEEGWGAYYATFEDYFAVYFPHQEQLWDDYRKGYISKEQLLLDRLRYPLRGQVSWSDQQVKELNHRFMQYVQQQTGLIPHALEVLAELHRDYTICIVSNGFEETQYGKINGSGLAPYIDKVILVDHVGVPKPEPEFFDYALKAVGCSRQEALVIGDSWPSDIICAFNSGIDSIWYNLWQVPMPDYDQQSHSVLEIRDLRELLPLLTPSTATRL